MTDLPKLLRRVDRYIRKHGMTPTTFGTACKKNPALVFRLREGNVTLKTVRHVSDWLDKAEAQQREAA